MTSKPPPEPRVQGQKPVTAQAGDVPLRETDQEIRRRLRLLMKAAIRRLDAETQRTAARHLAAHLAHFIKATSPGHLATYLPVRGEIDPNGFTAPESGIRALPPRLYLPRLKDEGLEFVLWETGTGFRTNRFGIPEPVTDNPIPPERLDAILVPLRAFDPWGHRLGTGGGFYDRTLGRGLHPGPLRIGVAHDGQQVEAIPEAPWDIRLDLVVTDRGWYRNGSFHSHWPGLERTP